MIITRYTGAPSGPIFIWEINGLTDEKTNKFSPYYDSSDPIQQME